MEVLGYLVTPEGLKMNPKKTEAIKKIPYPETPEEVLVYLGSVNFYRRFVPRIGMLAKPLTDMLRKKGTYDREGVRAAVDAINSYLVSDAVLGFPDYSDPNAEFVLCTDASHVAVGGVLLQWQWPGDGAGPDRPIDQKAPPKGSDAIANSWRLEAGYKLVTLGYYSKTLDKAQANYTVFDKEAGAILLAVRQFSDIITGHETTIYTDSSVAASMLTKHGGTPRLQRWGMELMSFMPHLKIGHRAGLLNGMADLLSRYQYFEKYIPAVEDVVSLPDDLYEQVAEVHYRPPCPGVSCALHAHRLDSGRSYVTLDVRVQRDVFRLYDLREPRPVSLQLWQEGEKPLAGDVGGDDGEHEDAENGVLLQMVRQLKAEVTECKFYAEQKQFDKYMEVLESYVAVFRKTHGRAPVMYDLYCGEGGFSRGARACGIKCYGFDIEPRYRRQYSTDPIMLRDGVPSRMDSGMSFNLRDVDDPAFWDELKERKRIGELPSPDIIHASPLCNSHSRLKNLKEGQAEEVAPGTVNVDELIQKLKTVEAVWPTPLIWQVENVQESRYSVESMQPTVVLCGTMMGHNVFRHRAFYCNYPATANLPHSHVGKLVGSRGMRVVKDQFEGRESNMWAPYSRRYEGRGTALEWHGALGHVPDTFSRLGIVGALPLGYGRLLGCQMVAHSLNRQFGVPVYEPSMITDHQRLTLSALTKNGAMGVRLCLVRDRLMPSPQTDPGLNQRSDVDVDPVVNEELQRLREPDRSIYEITKADQKLDPWCVRQYRLLKDQASRVRAKQQFEVVDGVLRYVDYSTGEKRSRKCVPFMLQDELMHTAHHSMSLTGHRSRGLYYDLSEHYYWPSMQPDCDLHVQRCGHCRQLAASKRTKVAPGLGKMPKLPMETIHADYKQVPVPSGGYKYILVVVCALTRYTIYIPTVDKSAATTLRALMENVFCVFGIPKKIVTDNGREFDNELADELGQYLGLRKITVLAYNPQANGVAESAVKRAKLLLERHTDRYRGWHKVLPLAQYILNSTVHHGTRESAFEMMFGRSAVTFPELEDPELAPQSVTGSAFLETLREKIGRLSAQIHEESEKLRAARQRRNLEVVPETELEVKEGDIVYVLKGSHTEAARIRKSGQGAYWRHRYKVLALTDYGVKVEPIEGSPVISQWQPLHKVSKSPVLLNDEDYQHAAAASGLVYAPGYRAEPRRRIRANDPFSQEEDGPPPDQDGMYEIDDILSAQKVKNRWLLEVKWAGYAETTWEPRAELLRSATPRVANLVKHAISTAGVRKTGQLTEQSDTETESESSSDEEEPEQRQTTQMYQVSMSEVMEEVVREKAEAAWWMGN